MACSTLHRKENNLLSPVCIAGIAYAVPFEDFSNDIHSVRYSGSAPLPPVSASFRKRYASFSAGGFFQYTFLQCTSRCGNLGQVTSKGSCSGAPILPCQNFYMSLDGVCQSKVHRRYHLQ